MGWVTRRRHRELVCSTLAIYIPYNTPTAINRSSPPPKKTKARQKKQRAIQSLIPHLPTWRFFSSPSTS